MAVDRTTLLATVRELGLPAGEYVVFGSGPLVVRGLREGNDIDLVVTADLYERLRADGWTPDTKDDGGEVLRHGDVEAMRRLEFPGYRRNVHALIESAEWIDGVPFTTLDELRTFKVALNRPKDHVDVELVDRELAEERAGAPTADEVARAEAVLAARQRRRRPVAAGWHGTGLTFVAGLFTRPGATFGAASGTTFWTTGYVVALVAAALPVGQVALRGGTLAWLLLVPVIAGSAVLLAGMAGGLAHATATSAGGDAAPVASQTAVLVGLGALPTGMVALVTGDQAASGLTAAVSSPLVLGMLALLYARSLDVAVRRGLLGALVGILGVLAVLVLLGFVAVLVSSVG